MWTILFISLYAFLSHWFSSRIDAKKVFIFFTSIHLIVVQGLRHINVGTDLRRYATHYAFSTQVPLTVYFESRFEVGYQFLNFLLASLGVSFQGFIFLVSVFVFTILGIFLYKYSESPWLSYMLYMSLGLFDFGFSGLRQAISMSIILVSFNSIIRKKGVKFLITVFIATLFHKTAIIFIVIYPLVNWEKVNRFYKLSYPLLFISFLAFGSVISRISISLFNEEILSRITMDSGLTTSALIVLIIFVFSLISKYCIQEMKQSRYFNILLTIVSVSLLLQLLSGYNYSFTRVNLYLFHYIIIIVPLVFKNWRSSLINKNKYGVFLINMLTYALLLTIIMLYYQNVLETNPHDIVPHQFFW